MTSITVRPSPDFLAETAPPDALLRFAMRGDATLCAGVGLLTAMTADPLSRLSGLSPTAEWSIGAVLVGYGALLFATASLADIRLAGLAVLAVNVVVTLLVGIALAAGWLPLTTTGVGLTLGLVAAGMCFAILQFLGVRRLRA
jgi:hypothetical protein